MFKQPLTTTPRPVTRPAVLQSVNRVIKKQFNQIINYIYCYTHIDLDVITYTETLLEFKPDVFNGHTAPILVVVANTDLLHNALQHHQQLPITIRNRVRVIPYITYVQNILDCFDPDIVVTEKNIFSVTSDLILRKHRPFHWGAIAIQNVRQRLLGSIAGVVLDLRCTQLPLESLSLLDYYPGRHTYLYTFGLEDDVDTDD